MLGLSKSATQRIIRPGVAMVFLGSMTLLWADPNDRTSWIQAYSIIAVLLATALVNMTLRSFAQFRWMHHLRYSSGAIAAVGIGFLAVHLDVPLFVKIALAVVTGSILIGILRSEDKLFEGVSR